MSPSCPMGPGVPPSSLTAGKAGQHTWEPWGIVSLGGLKDDNLHISRILPYHHNIHSYNQNSEDIWRGLSIPVCLS